VRAGSGCVCFGVGEGEGKSKGKVTKGMFYIQLEHYCVYWHGYLQTAKEAEPEDDEEPVFEITTYILVKKPMPTVSSKSHLSKVKDEDQYVQKGPFKFKSNDKYPAFLFKIADTLSCPVHHIIESKVTWKSQAPVCLPLPLGSSTSFLALVEHFGSKKNGRVFMILMPPPVKPVNDKPASFLLRFETLLTRSHRYGPLVKQKPFLSRNLTIQSLRHLQLMIILCNNR
jgi:hypothetical protein